MEYASQTLLRHHSYVFVLVDTLEGGASYVSTLWLPTTTAHHINLFALQHLMMV